MSDDQPIRLVVVDDHPLFREGVVSLMTSADDVQVVGEASSAEQGLELTDAVRPDVVLMDLHMPGMDGIDAIRTIARRHSDVGVIALTMLNDDESVFAAMRAGARGYVLKDAQRGSLLRAIRAVANGEALLGDIVARRILTHLGTPPGANEPHTDPDIERLTPREHEVLNLIAQGARNADIAKQLFISERTVGNHISNIFRKLHVSDRSQAIIRARDAGMH